MTMTREEAIKELYAWLDGCCGDEEIEPAREAFKMAIEALRAQDVTDTNVGDIVYRQAAIDAMINSRSNADVTLVPGSYTNGWRDGRKLLLDELLQVVFELPSVQPECIQNNTVHLCDSCQYTYVTCPSHGNDAVFGDGKGNDNICACNKYRPISAQSEREHAKFIRWMECKKTDKYISYTPHCKCSKCGNELLIEAINYCYMCGAKMEGERRTDEQSD